MPKPPSPENNLPSDIPFGWWPCFNVTDEIIPGYGHVKFCSTRFDPTDEDQLEFINRDVDQVHFEHSQELVAGQAIIRVRKPLAPADDPFGSDRTRLGFFTWQHPILPHQFGLCTRLLQRRALVYAQGPDYEVEVQAPLAVDPDNPWALYVQDSDETQYACMFMDSTDRRSRRPPEENGEDWKLTVCWIEPAGSGE